MRSRIDSANRSAAFNSAIGNHEYKHRQANFNTCQATPRQLQHTARSIGQAAPRRFTPSTALFYLALFGNPQLLLVRSAPDKVVPGFSGEKATEHHEAGADKYATALLAPSGKFNQQTPLADTLNTQRPAEPFVVATQPGLAHANVKHRHRKVRSEHLPRMRKIGHIGAVRPLQPGEPVRADMQLPGKIIPHFADEEDIVHHDTGAQRHVAGQSGVSQENNGIEDTFSEEIDIPWHQQIDSLGMTEDARAKLAGCNKQVHELLSTKSMAVRKSTFVSQRLLIEEAINFLEQSDDTHASLARHLQRASGFYGSHVDELMSRSIQMEIIRNWITLNLFGQSLEDLIASMVLNHQRAAHLNTADLHRFVLDQAFRTDLITAKFKPWILSHVLIPQLPTLGYFETYPASTDPDCSHLEKVLLNVKEWAHIHAGMRMAHLVGINTDIDIKDAERLGQYLAAQLQEGAASSLWWGLFRLPAWIRYVQNKPEAVINSTETMKTEAQAEAMIDFAIADEKSSDTYFPLVRFKTQLLSYMTRPQLAQKIIDSQCPGANVSQYLNHPKTNGCREKGATNQQNWGSNPVWILSDPPNAISYADLPDLNQLYQAQIDTLASTYQILDRAVLLTAWDSLSIDDINYIGNAEVRWVEASFSAARLLRNAQFSGGDKYAVNRLTISPKSGVDFISAQCTGRAERIYVLHATGLTYEMERIDTDAQNYYAYFDNAVEFIDRSKYELVITRLQGPLKSDVETIATLSERISEKHRHIFSKQLYDHGYEKTTTEKVIDTLLSFVPLYTCVDSINSGKTADALLACSIDAISFTPLIGSIVKLSTNLAHIFGKGMLLATRDAAIEMQLRNSLQAALRKGAAGYMRYAVLPATESLNNEVFRTLALNTLRSVDPGIELVASMSYAAVRQSVQLMQAVNRMPSLSEVLGRMNTLANPLPRPIAPEKYIIARRSGLSHEITAIRLGGDHHKGKSVYVQINPNSGEAFGRKYVLEVDGTLHPIPTEMAMHLQNILDQGLGGKGAIEQGANWATDKISAKLLRNLQAEIAKGDRLQDVVQRHQLQLDNLSLYISDYGDLTPLGNALADWEEAGPSHVQPKETRRDIPISSNLSPDFLLTQVAPQINTPASSTSFVRPAFSPFSGPVMSPTDLLPLETRRGLAYMQVKRCFTVNVDKITAKKDGLSYAYKLDLDAFVLRENPQSGFYYLADPDPTQLRPMCYTRLEAEERNLFVNDDRRSAVLKALDVDLDLASILKREDWTPTIGKFTLPKRISYIWVGPMPINDKLINNLTHNFRIARLAGYKVYFYLSKQSRDANYERVLGAMQQAMPGPQACTQLACTRPLFPEYELKILEETKFFKEFETSDYIVQYNDAIDGNKGKATIFSSACDIVRLALIKKKGGFYMDVDDTLQEEHFKNINFRLDSDEILFGSPMLSPKLDMYMEYGTSFFAAMPENPILEKILREIHRRYHLAEFHTFYKEPRPKFEEELPSKVEENPVEKFDREMREKLKREKYKSEVELHRKKLFQLTGPGVFNSVLRKESPAHREFLEFCKLEKIVYQAQVDQVMIRLQRKMPPQLKMMRLLWLSKTGSEHSWTKYR